GWRAAPPGGGRGGAGAATAPGLGCGAAAAGARAGGAAASGASAGAPPGPAITATTAPTGATSPTPIRISASTPVSVEGTSIDTLSVSISNRLSPGFTASPADLNHFVILPSATVSPSCGISTSIVCTRPAAERLSDALPDDGLRRADRAQDQPVADEPVLPHDVGRCIRTDVAFAVMRHRAGSLIDRVGSEVG